jgi:osmotically-inducible protein OsmY
MNLKRATLILAGTALLAGCPAPTAIQKAGTDQEIATQIVWELRKDPRFVDVVVKCLHRQVTLSGRVNDAAAAADAVAVAQDHARGAEVVSKVEVRPR